MAPTPDRFPGEREEARVKLSDEGDGVATVEGEVGYTGGRFTMYDGSGEFDPRSGGGISESEHRQLDQLAHKIDESCYESYTFSGRKVSNVTIWTDSGMTTKIREYAYTYTGFRITQEVVTQYDVSGSWVERLTRAFAYTGSQIVNITTTRTTP